MAIKITGTTVINDSRGLENFPDTSQIIRTPSVTSPTDNATDVDPVNLTITGTPYLALFSNTRDYREFQIDLSTGDFSSPVVSQQVNSDSLTLDVNDNRDFKVRIRDVDLDGNVSEFSDIVNFTTPTNNIENVSLGDSFCGGFYMGTITASGTCYALIVAPNSTGCQSGCQWKTERTATPGTCSLDDGFANTYPALTNSTHPAGNWTATRTINGFSDWYLPSVDELEKICDNGAGKAANDPLPSGEELVTATWHWTSTEVATNIEKACTVYSSNGLRGSGFAKTYDNPKIRAIRRIPRLSV